MTASRKGNWKRKVSIAQVVKIHISQKHVTTHYFITFTDVEHVIWYWTMVGDALWLGR